ncbi:homing endonuclease associated repeat-containing protein [Halorussus halophilus]|uniref:homing endonuclease associated repeat-containing protein n=1 Tax=Halorussus halophilus TaxID=2650975 RepID=UPI0013010197|nr:hypothetical protein [Halorussus halophilus]
MSHPTSADEATLRTSLQSLAAQLGKTPTVVEMHEQGDHDPHDYLDVFGGWDHALQEAGLDPDEAKVKITDRELLVELQRLEQQLGHTPTQEDVAEQSDHSHQTYKNRFGSWNNAIEQAMLPTNDISEKDLRQELERVADDLGHPPTAEEMNQHGEYAAVTYHRRFGSWLDALNECDFDTTQTQITDTELLTEIERVATELEKSPSETDFEEHGRFHPQTYTKRFGSWNQARELAGVAVPTQKISEQELLADLVRIAESLGHEPVQAEIDEHSQFGIATYHRHFNSLDEARRRALD